MADQKHSGNAMSPEARKRIDARRANIAAKRAARQGRDLTEREKMQLGTLRNVQGYIDAAIDDIERGEGVSGTFMGAVFAVGQAFQVVE